MLLCDLNLCSFVIGKFLFQQIKRSIIATYYLYALADSLFQKRRNCFFHTLKEPALWITYFAGSILVTTTKTHMQSVSFSTV